MDSPYRDYRLWMLKRWSAVLIQRQFRGFSARKKGLPSLMDSEETETDGSPSLLDSEESKAYGSSFSSLQKILIKLSANFLQCRRDISRRLR